MNAELAGGIVEPTAKYNHSQNWQLKSRQTELPSCRVDVVAFIFQSSIQGD